MAEIIGTIKVPVEHDELFEKMTKVMIDLHDAKNADYGDAFHDAFSKLGMNYALGLLYNKISRLITLNDPKHTQQVQNEGSTDNLMDIACYALMTLIEFNKERTQ